MGHILYPSSNLTNHIFAHYQSVDKSNCFFVILIVVLFLNCQPIKQPLTFNEQIRLCTVSRRPLHPIAYVLRRIINLMTGYMVGYRHNKGRSCKISYL